MKIVVTDLTRFSNPDLVCLAGIDIETGKCIRPLPYLPMQFVKENNILPSDILESNFISKGSSNPHAEDCSYENISKLGIATTYDFEAILSRDLSTSISHGFNYNFAEKKIPIEFAPNKSIITIKLNTSQIKIVNNIHDATKIKLHLNDNDGREYPFLPITDLGFHSYFLQNNSNLNFINEVNNFIRSYQDVYLRVGLAREYQGAYWLQINGIYLFSTYRINHIFRDKV